MDETTFSVMSHMAIAELRYQPERSLIISDGYECLVGLAHKIAAENRASKNN